MGTSGSRGLTEVLVGSNTERVVRTAPVPVISIHKGQKISHIQNIVFPTTIDLDQHRFMWQIRALQSFFNAHLHLLYVKTPDTKETEKSLTAMLTDLAKYYDLSDFSVHITKAATEEKGVLRFASRMPGSMIAMATHGYAGLTHRGHPDELVQATTELQAWADEQGLRLDRAADGRWGCRLELFHTHPAEVPIGAWVTELAFKVTD